jgi:tetratricopeptide (TPR) repeat protein
MGRVLWLVMYMLVVHVSGLPSAASAQTHAPRFAELDERWAAGAFHETLVALRQMRAERPGNVEVLWRLSWVKTDLGRQMEDGAPGQAALYREAMEDAQRAVAVGPNHAQAHLSLAVAAGLSASVAGTRDRVRYSRVVQDHVNRAIELNPQSDVAFMVRGLWHMEVASLGFFTRTIVRTVYGGLPNASHAQAAQDFRRAIELNDRIIHRIGLGRALIELGRTEEARTELRLALAMPGEGPGMRAHRQRARELLSQLGDRG